MLLSYLYLLRDKIFKLRFYYLIMSKHRNSTSKPPKVSILYYVVILLISFLFLLGPLTGYKYSYADDFSSNNYQLTYKNNLISISAKKADLKNILIDIADKTGISIRYPTSLDKKITLKISEMSIKRALKRVLKGFNYSIIYSGTKKRAVISDVYILNKDKGSSRRVSNRSNTASRIEDRIQSYQRRIEIIKKNLSKVDENSAKGKRYLRQVQSYEKTIERLKSQL